MRASAARGEAPIDRLLSRLERVRRTGEGRYIATCPSHRDDRPSLSVRELADGRVLIHCFGGCSAVDVVTAAKLDLADLYPRMERSSSWPLRQRPPRLPTADALAVLDLEALTVVFIASALARGEPVERHQADLQLAARRIATIRAGWMESPR